MKISTLKTLSISAVAIGALAVFSTPDSVEARGKRASAHSSINGGGHKARPSSRPNRGGSNARRPGRGGGNSVVSGNTVVVNKPSRGRPPRGDHGGYHTDHGWDNDRRHHHRHHDDDDFLEFVGKTAAVTAGAAVVGSILTSRPSDDCREQVSNGQVYLYCNGNWYQPVQNGNNVNYVVVNQP